MRIKKLEINGFKSFADRAILNFDSGVTGVVGPNGCGKSNIVDALRWVMGEQNARHLRGGQMQDIIFNGSQTKSPMGYAEVTLILENDGQGVPTDYEHFTEIQVSRRLYRTGDSEYEINKRPCRLKDITDLFLGTGVGTKAYSIIEQGKVSALVSSKPEERRQIIEEAAGITKYKSKRAAAERKMQATEQNLLRINDVKKEVETRLETLEKQAKKAAKYKNLTAEIKELDLHLGVFQFLEFTAHTRFLETQEAVHDEQFKGITATLQQCQEEMAAERNLLSDKEKALQLTQNLLFEVDNTIALTKQDITFLKSTEESQKRKNVQVVDEIKRLSYRHSDLLIEQKKLQEEKQNATVECQQTTQTLTDAQENLRIARENQYNHAAKVQVLQKAATEFAQLAAKMQGQIQTLEKKREDAKQRRQVIEKEKQQAQHQAEQTLERITAVEAELQENTTKREELKSLIHSLQAELAAHQTLWKTQQDEHQRLSSETAQKQGRLVSLQEIEHNFEGSSEGIASVMTQPLHEGIVGLVADFIEAPKEMESLVENALRHVLETIVVQSKEKAISIAQQLKGAQKGRVRFYVQPSPAKAFSLPVSLPGYRLIDRVNILHKQDELVEGILGHIVIVENLEAAFSAWSSARQEGFVLMTLQGDLLDTDGTLTTGTRSKNSGVLSRKREIRDLTEAVALAHSQISTLQAEIEKTQSQLNEFRLKLETTHTREKELAIGLARLEENCRSKKAEHQRWVEQQDKLDKEWAQMSLFLESSEKEQEDLNHNWAQALEKHQKEEDELSTLSDGTERLSKELNNQNEATTQLRIVLAQRQERSNQLERSLQQLTKNLEDITSQLSHLKQQDVELSKEQAHLVEQIQLGDKKLLTANTEREIVAAQLAKDRTAYDTHFEHMRERENKVETIRLQQEEVRELLNDVILQKETKRLGKEAINSRLKERYQLLASDILIDYHHRPLPEFDFEQKLTSLRRSLEQLGTVNPAAVEEYEEFKLRFEFLHTQSTDLTQALTQLQTAIRTIDKTTHLRFEEAFNAINQRFSQVFPRLFRGGKAWLELTQPDDLLNTGVEIYAQPPGKKLGSIVLMSGGEKALTAISLIFAIFLIKPSPFCLLDEVDAPLDEANVERFSQLVKEMSNISQFIVITHNKRTMEIVDQLYGITMEEAGASKTVNVRVQEPTPPQQETIEAAP